MRLGVFGRGRLGTAVAQAAEGQLVWQVGRGAPPEQRVECAIEAGAGEGTAERVDWALANGTPLVIASTGWSLPDLAERVAGRIGVVVAPNLSLSVALLLRMTRVLARFAALDPARDPYVLEQHHSKKRDAPGGTAKLLAEAILAECPRKTSYRMPPSDRALRPDELCVSAVRGGHTASSHVVAVDAPGEVLELAHRARDLSPYGEGALAAARWIVGKRGLHRMDDVAADLLEPLFRNLSGREAT